MHIAFLNPQGNFDPADSYLAEHPDFGGQLIYVKQVALAMGDLGHKVDIITRQILDPDWPEFSNPQDVYPGSPNVRIIRLPAGPEKFLPKEQLWPYLGPEWVPNIIDFYRQAGKSPDFFSAHYADGGISAALLRKHTGIPFSFTAHSLGAHKMDSLRMAHWDLQELENKFSFSRRLLAERTAMNHSLVNIASTIQERHVQYNHPAYLGAVDVTDDNRFTVIPPGVDLAVFGKNATSEVENFTINYLQSMLARDIEQERLDLPCIIASSRIDVKKNHLGLVKAFASSRELREISNLVILTSGLVEPMHDYSQASPAEKDVLRQLMEVIDEYGLRGEIAMFSLKGQSELGTAYRFFSRLGSIFTLPAFHEPFGLAPLEAMAAGLPAVVTKFGGPSESMQEGLEEFGLLIDPSNSEDLSSAMLSLLNKPDLWGKFAQAGYNRVVSKYNWEKTAAAYLDVLKREYPGCMTNSQLPIHPYFVEPVAANIITLVELEAIYKGRI